MRQLLLKKVKKISKQGFFAFIGNNMIGMYRHKYKLLLFCSPFVFYMYQQKFLEGYNQLSNVIKSKINTQIENAHSETKTILKDTIVETLKHDEVASQGVDYLLILLKDKTTIDQILSVLIQSIKAPEFIDEAKILGKEIVKDAAIDKEVENSLTKLFVRIFKTEEIKNEGKNLLLHIISQNETKEELVQLIEKAFTDDRLTQSMKELLKKAFFELFTEQETIEAVRFLLINVLKSFVIKGNKGFSDLIIDRILTDSKQDPKIKQGFADFDEKLKKPEKDLDLIFNRLIKK